MSEPATSAQVEAARAYEAVFVPALLAQWTPRVADAARVGPGGRVLDVGCGTGILAREMARRVGASGSVVGIDPNAGMLEEAKRLAPDVEASATAVTSWVRGVAESLPFPDGSFDAVASQFALMFFSDRRRALREMLRVLRPGGRLAIAVWGSLESMLAFAAEVDVLEREAGRAASDALRAPFVLGDRSELASLFEDAGAEATRVDAHEGTARFPSLRTLVEADLRGWLPVMGVVLEEDVIGRVLRVAERDLAEFASADGRAVFRLSALIASARKPEPAA